MPLYITERVSETDVMYNPFAKFVYFDTVKKDSTTPLTLLLRDQKHGLPIRFRNNMSSSGEWLNEEFDNRYRQLVSEDFKGVFDVLRNATLVIYPIRIFNIIMSTLDTKAHNFFITKFKDLERNNEI